MKPTSAFFPYLLILSLLAACIEVEVSAPSFPDIAAYFKISDSRVQLTIALNLIGICLASLFYGPLSDSFGRRKIMLPGNFLMLLGSFGCVFSDNITILYLSRFFQGIGAATSAVVVFAIASDVYRGNGGVRIIGLFNAIFSFSMAGAPIFGGFLNESLGWRGNYSFIALLTLFSWISLFYFLPETLEKKRPFRMDLVFKDYFKLSTNKKFLVASAVPSLSYAGYIAFISCAPFLYMVRFSMGTYEYVAHQAFPVAVFAITSLYASRVTGLLGIRRSIFWSCLLMVIGIFITAAGQNSPYPVTFGTSVDSFASAILYPVIFNYSLEIFPDIKGTASSFTMSMRTALMALLVAAAGYFYDGTVFSLVAVLGTNVAIMVLLVLYLRFSDKIFFLSKEEY